MFNDSDNFHDGALTLMLLSRVCKAAKSLLKTCVVCLKNKCKGILRKAALSEIRLSSLNPFYWRIFRKLGLPAK